MSGKYDNSGTLGTNKRKEKETHPSHSGQCSIDGKEFWISAWVKEGRDGRFFSLSFRPKEARAQAAETPPPKTSSDDFDDDIPF